MNQIIHYSLSLLLFLCLTTVNVQANSNDDNRIHTLIQDVRAKALNIKIDGNADDWEGIPIFSYDNKEVADAALDITAVSIAPLEDRLLILLKTKAMPKKTGKHYWLDIDLLGAQPKDIQLGLQAGASNTLWVYEKGKKLFKEKLAPMPIAIDEVVEIEIPYRALQSKLPASMRNRLNGYNGRPWVRVIPFTYNAKYIDRGPAVASYKLLPEQYPLDDQLPSSEYDPQLMHMPLEGTWYVSQGAFGVWTHQNHWSYDLEIFDSNHQRARGDGLDNNYAFGKKVLAPLDGLIVRAESNQIDYPSKKRNVNAISNLIAIRASSDTVVRLVHLQQYSVRYGAHDRVAKGTHLAKVGNSGPSAEPHLHLDAYIDSKSNRIPIAFRSVEVRLNLSPQDPWKRNIDTWNIREGYFVESVSE